MWKCFHDTFAIFLYMDMFEKSTSKCQKPLKYFCFLEFKHFHDHFFSFWYFSYVQFLASSKCSDCFPSCLDLPYWKGNASLTASCRAFWISPGNLFWGGSAVILQTAWPSGFSNWAGLDTPRLGLSVKPWRLRAAPDLVGPFLTIHPFRADCHSWRGRWEVSIRLKMLLKNKSNRRHGG